MSEEVFKNIQVLKGIPVSQFMETMGFFSASLGVNCTYCHVQEAGGNWAKYADDNAHKQMARRMVLMMQSMNKANFGGRRALTCYSCHRGDERPRTTPSLVDLYGPPISIDADDIFETGPQSPARRSNLRQIFKSVRRHPNQLHRQRHLPRLRRARQEPRGSVRESPQPAHHHHSSQGGRQHHGLRRPRRLVRRALDRSARNSAPSDRLGSQTP